MSKQPAPSNLTLMTDTNTQTISAALEGKRLHCTNGTYVPPEKLVVPTTLAGFKYVEDTRTHNDDAFLVAVNSDASMKAIYHMKGASEKEWRDLEGPEERAMKVAGPLADLFPDREIIAVFYDDETPNALYRSLRDSAYLGSLHKWGYGTSPLAPGIEGAECFREVLAFPLPNDIKPVCYDLTRGPGSDNQPGKIIKLTDEIGPHDKPYITPTNQVLFPVPGSLTQYGVPRKPEGSVPAVAPRMP